MAKITIEEVARRAGVSIATVSRVINGNYPVSDETKEMIKKVIEETNFRPNAIAASLRRRCSMTIGMVVSKFNNPLVMQVVRGVESVVEPKGYQLIVGSSQNDLVKEKQLLYALQERMVDAVIVFSVSKDARIFQDFLNNGIPVIIVDRCVPGAKLDTVVNDDELSSYKLVKYLIDHGHSRIAVVKGRDDIAIGMERYQGYIRAMKEAKLPIVPDYQIEGNFQREIAYKKTLQLFRTVPSSKLPTAFFASNTLMAEGVIQAVYEVGYEIPHHFSMVCFGVLSSSPVLRPRLVCVDQRSLEVGIAAGELALKRLSNSLRKPVKKVIATRFIEGDTVKRISPVNP